MPPKFNALIEYEDTYVQPLILAALSSRLPKGTCTLLNPSSCFLPLEAALLQFRAYESIDFESAIQNTSTHLINSYVIRKALIRKHYLSTTIGHWVTKHPDSVLKDHFKPGVDFELDYAEFLDDALVEAFELRESLERNEGKAKSEREWWILKPGMSDRGQGIRLFSTEGELTAIFEEWEEANPSSDDEDEDQAVIEPNVTSENYDNTSKAGETGKDDYVITSQLRHFVAQPYIAPPLLLPSEGSHKFHIRTYVLAVGALKVYVYKPMLALFAAERYAPPWEQHDLRAHLTNTCLQGQDIREGSVKAYWSLSDDAPSLPVTWKQSVWEQICKVTGEVFEATARGMMVHFQPLPNAFELFGLDFLVDAGGTAWLLEVNAFPDFKQTGDELQHVIQGLFEDVVDVAIKPFFDPENDATRKVERMQEVLNIDLGRR